MILTAEDIQRMESSGAKVTSPNGSTSAEPEPEQPDEIELLQEIAGKLEEILNKTEPPQEPPNVVVNHQQIRQWRFLLKKPNEDGSREIIATAVE